jgi:hypothetical protein
MVYGYRSSNAADSMVGIVYGGGGGCECLQHLHPWMMCWNGVRRHSYITLGIGADIVTTTTMTISRIPQKIARNYIVLRNRFLL